MKTTRRISFGGVAERLLLVAVCLAGCLAGYVTVTAGIAEAGQGRTIWKSREQFVDVVPREREGSGSAVNEHPASVYPLELRRFLSSVALSREGDETPLFSEAELKVLESAGVKGLRQAGPDEDVTFAVFGYHTALQGFLKETKVTTGRMFYQDGKLNLILGIVQREVMDNEDRRLNPFVPGSRLKQADLAGRITAAAGTTKRSDWLVFSPYSDAPPVVEGAQSRPEPDAPVVVPAVPPQETPKRVDRPANQPRSLEERLILLNDLKQKGLITDEEYRAKRLRILDEI